MLIILISCFVIDFLSPRLLLMIVTSYSHVLYTKMMHFVLRSILAIIIVQLGEEAITYDSG